MSLLPLKRSTRRLLRNSGVIPFQPLWSAHSTFPDKIGLSLSVLCTADCIFCPERAPGMAPKVMPLQTVRTIIEQAQQHGYRGLFSIGENGDALTHPEFGEIVSLIRSAFPLNDIVLFSSMILMDERRARIVFGHRVNVVHFNVDGASAETYNYIKRHAPFNQVRKNILEFLKLRDALGAQTKVMVGYVTARSFAEEFVGAAGRFLDDGDQIEAYFRPLLRPTDSIQREDNILLDKFQDFLGRPKREPCDAFETVLRELVVAPNGQAYVCCRDFGVRSDLGNVNESSIARIWSGERRRRLVENLFFMRNDEASPACRNCLPGLGINGDLYEHVRGQIRELLRSAGGRQVEENLPSLLK
jgi:radical SAM protein with 4Fe4S-binding SPASM domain